MDNHIKMGTPRPPTPAEVAWGEEMAMGLGESAVADNRCWIGTPREVADLKLSPEEVEHGIRLDERRKAEQEIADYLYRTDKEQIPGYWRIEHIRQGGYRNAPQQAVAPDSSPDLSEARGEVGGEGDRDANQAPAKENEDLRPCPFCGAQALLYQQGFMGFVTCGSCGANGAHHATWAQARSAWNTRPVEDRLRQEAAGLFQQTEFLGRRIDFLLDANRRLEQDHAEAMSLVLAHEGRIENQVRVIDQLLDEKKKNERSIADQATYNKHLSGQVQKHYQAYLDLQQQLAEEKQYNDVLEKRLKEEEGKFCSAVEANGMHYEGGRQEAEEEVVAYLRRKAGMFEQNNGDKKAATLLRVHAFFISKGCHRNHDEGAETYPDEIFDRAQLRAETEVATAGRVADWLKGRYDMQIVPEMIREGVWREKAVDALGGLSEPEAGGGLSEVAPDNDPLPPARWESPFAEGIARAVAAEFLGEDPVEEEEVFTEELGRVAAEQDPGDFEWARHQVCALIRWSLGLEGGGDLAVHAMRGSLTLILGWVERMMKTRGDGCASA
jgi:hypothetical protein